jgi:hypothetical protein
VEDLLPVLPSMKFSDGAEGFIEQWLGGQGRGSSSSLPPVFADAIESAMEKQDAAGTSAEPRTVVVPLTTLPASGGSHQTVVSIDTKEVIPKNNALYNPAIVDTKTSEMFSLADAIARGLFDPRTGQVVDAATGRRLSLSEAVRQGLIE